MNHLLGNEKLLLSDIDIFTPNHSTYQCGIMLSIIT